MEEKGQRQLRGEPVQIAVVSIIMGIGHVLDIMRSTRVVNL